VAVEGEDIDVSLMAGRWEGTYEGIESGRRGTISLDLAAGNRVAEGKVVMNAGAPQEKLLPIKFFKVGGKEVNGKIEPYTDPGCNCTVNTEFVGKVRGNLISGTFTTQPEGGSAKQNGRWSAERKR
jgi:hypothetical protein